MIREQDGWTHIRLFDWNGENDFFIRLFLNSLKKGGPRFIFNKITMEYVHRVVQKYPIPMETVLVPAPVRSDHCSSDHAFCLALSFSRLMGLDLFNPLRRSHFLKKEGFQKGRDRQERKKIKFHINKDSFHPKKIIFVDDILTTGATARAAWQALKKPRCFVIFTLAWRCDLML